MEWIAENWPWLSAVAVAALGGAVAVLKIVAPRTETTADDKAADFLDKVLGWFKR